MSRLLHTPHRPHKRPVRAASCVAWFFLALLVSAEAHVPQEPADTMNASAHMTCAGPQSALRLQSPVCGRPLVTRKKHHRVNSLPTRPPGCGAELCSIRGGGSSHLVPAGPPMDLPCNTPSSGSGAQQRASVVARAAHHSSASASASAATAEKAKWWKRDAELWVDVHTEEEFEAAVTTGDKLVLVGALCSECVLMRVRAVCVWGRVFGEGAPRMRSQQTCHASSLTHNIQSHTPPSTKPTTTHTHRLFRDLVPWLPKVLPGALPLRARPRARVQGQVCQGLHRGAQAAGQGGRRQVAAARGLIPARPREARRHRHPAVQGQKLEGQPADRPEKPRHGL
jgi:hypothetical protein